MARILIFTPGSMGVTHIPHNGSTLLTFSYLLQCGHGVNLVQQSSSNICTSRNKAVGMLLNGNYTHLLFLDSDMSWDEPEAILHMLAADVDVVTGGYLSRTDNPYWTFRLKGGGRVEDIAPIGPYNLLPLSHAATGFMLCKRRVFETITHQRPDLKCNFDSALPPEEPNHYLIFDQRISAEKIEGIAHYTTDDFGFSETWTALGGELWLYPHVTIHHHRTTANTGNVGVMLDQVGVPITPPPALPKSVTNIRERPIQIAGGMDEDNPSNPASNSTSTSTSTHTVDLGRVQ